MRIDVSSRTAITAKATVLAFLLGSCHGLAQGSQSPSAVASATPELYAGYAALDYRSKYAPPLAREHEREIADAILREPPAARPRLRYTTALTGRGTQRVFVIFRDIGQPKDARLRQLYAVVNLRNMNYDPISNTIVAQAPL